MKIDKNIELGTPLDSHFGTPPKFHPNLNT
jgi:hypothetical protein